MPSRSARERARADRRTGKAPTTRAGEYVREEIHHVRIGRHGARSARQAIAIGLDKARREGVPVPPPEGTAPTERPSGRRRRTPRARRSTPRGGSPGRRGRAATARRGAGRRGPRDQTRRRRRAR